MPFCIFADIDLPEKTLIQLVDDSVPLIVTREMLLVAIAGGDMSGYSQAAQDATAAAVAVIDKAIADVDTLIEAHVGERYALPFTAVPKLLKSIAVDLVTWKLFFRRNQGKVPEAVQSACDNANKLLAQIRDGKLGIGVVPVGEPAPVTVAGGSIKIAAATATFTEESLKGF